MLVIGDSTLDKMYSKKIELVTHHWSGKHHRVVKGINLISLLWTDGDSLIPCDYRVYAKENDGLTKNDHFRAMLKLANDRGFSPAYVSFDSWYSSLENLKTIRNYGWMWLTRLQSNRLVNPDNTGNRPLSEIEISSIFLKPRYLISQSCFRAYGKSFSQNFPVFLLDEKRVVEESGKT